MDNTERATKIAKINDRARSTWALNVTLTQGLVLAFEDVEPLLTAIEQYDKFDEDNDPYGEHDFGSLEWLGQTVFWKIDYYDRNFQTWHDPLEPGCNRVMTIMLASEY